MRKREEVIDTDTPKPDGAKAGAAGGQREWPVWKKNEDPPEHVVAAWEMVCRGFDNWASIARALGFNPQTSRKKVKRDVIRLSKALSIAEGSGTDPKAEAITKYSRLTKELWRLYDEAKGKVDTTRDGDLVIQTVHPRNQRLQLNALRQLVDITEKEAAIRGVVTKREAHENTDTNPIVPIYNVNIKVKPTPVQPAGDAE